MKACVEFVHKTSKLAQNTKQNLHKSAYVSRPIFFQSVCLKCGLENNEWESYNNILIKLYI